MWHEWFYIETLGKLLSFDSKKYASALWKNDKKKIYYAKCEEWEIMGFGDAFIYELALWKNDKKYGYAAKCARRMVMQNVDDHTNEEMVLSHSEKLAITLGLIITPQEPVSWLLRMKGDCCERYSSQFHHFYNGSCSCGDH